MYHAFYSLNSTPFSKEIKAKDAFLSDAFSEACSRLEFLKKTRGIGMLTGEPGAGKTLILRAFAQKLNKELYKVVYFPLSTGTVMEFYVSIPGAL